ncbi:MAG: site-2 protease family protein, partial [Bacteroidota bacterium]
MENFDDPLPGMNKEENSASGEERTTTPLSDYERLPELPPKFERQEQSSNIWLRSFLSLAAYLVLGYYIFPSYKILLLITVIVMIHEFGHFFAMKFFHYKDLGIFFIPLLGAYVSGSKREVSQKESAIILLAGPLPGIIIGIVIYLIYDADPLLSFAGLSYYTISLSFILLNLINLLPVYPLDGGQLLNRVFLDEESWVSKIFVFLSIGFLVWFALYGTSRPFYALL